MPSLASGTMIATPKGEVPIERLRVGDPVVTRDHGIRPVCWTGTRHLPWAQLQAQVHLRPVLVTQAAFGNGLPERDLLASPEQRFLVHRDRTALRLDGTEALVAAKHLVGLRRVVNLDSAGLRYVSILFDRHEVILAEGVWTESFQPEDRSLRGQGNAQRVEAHLLFPDLRFGAGPVPRARTAMPAAR